LNIVAPASNQDCYHTAPRFDEKGNAKNEISSISRLILKMDLPGRVD